MPTYMVHGFRWPRPLIRIHIILQNLDDAASEWLMAPATHQTMMQSFNQLHPHLMPNLPNLRFIEQYDPTDDTTKSQPYAYVADTVHEIPLGVAVDEITGQGVKNETWGALMELRDKIAPGEKVAWFVVVCGDTERWAPPAMGNGSIASESSINSVRRAPTRDSFTRAATSIEDPSRTSPRGFRKWFGGKKEVRRARSQKSLTSSPPTSGARSPPPDLPYSPPATAQPPPMQVFSPPIQAQPQLPQLPPSHVQQASPAYPGQHTYQQPASYPAQVPIPVQPQVQAQAQAPPMQSQSPPVQAQLQTTPYTGIPPGIYPHTPNSQQYVQPRTTIYR